MRSLASVLLLHSSAEDQKNKFLPHTGQGIPRGATEDTTGPHGTVYQAGESWEWHSDMTGSPCVFRAWHAAQSAWSTHEPTVI